MRKTPRSAFFFTPPQCETDAQSWFFPGDPETRLVAETADQIDTILRVISESDKTGFGYIRYEAGYSIMGIDSPFENDQTFAEFFLYSPSCAEMINSASLMKNFRPSANGTRIRDIHISDDEVSFTRSIAEIHDQIRRGNTYQVNFTTRVRFMLDGDADELFLSLIFRQSAAYTALINTGRELIVSLSPELFFEICGNKIRCRPMKGTAARGSTPDKDMRARTALSLSEKNRAENLMIVDLLRNDMSHAGISPRTLSLFDIEEYETVFQLTSTIEGSCPDKIDLPSIMRSLFPCGSVTGAPKRKTMELISSLESAPRGIYTGAIGLITPDRSVFSVPIRTAVIDQARDEGLIGAGSGIVWDSSPDGEYLETVSKIAFLTDMKEPYHLIETMRAENGQIAFLDQHLDRLSRAARRFRFMFDRSEILPEITGHLLRLDPCQTYRIRCILHKWGALDIHAEEFRDLPLTPVTVVLSDISVDQNDPFLYHKTSRRDLFESERKKYCNGEVFEVIFMNCNQIITEGSITNIFIRYDGSWLTSPVTSGMIDGVYRRHFIREHDVIEKPFGVHELRNSEMVILTNALRGEIRVGKIITAAGEVMNVP